MARETTVAATRVRLALAAVGFGLPWVAAACTDGLTDINTNPNAPTDVPAGLLLPQAIQNTVQAAFGSGQMLHHTGHLAAALCPDPVSVRGTRAGPCRKHGVVLVGLLLRGPQGHPASDGEGHRCRRCEHRGRRSDLEVVDLPRRDRPLGRRALQRSPERPREHRAGLRSAVAHLRWLVRGPDGRRFDGGVRSRRLRLRRSPLRRGLQPLAEVRQLTPYAPGHATLGGRPWESAVGVRRRLCRGRLHE